jgi:hypothetical protein
MRTLAADEIMKWPSFSRAQHIDDSVLAPLYANFTGTILQECGISADEPSKVAVIGTGFGFSRLNLVTFIALVQLHSGTSFEAIMEEYAEAISDEISHDGPDVMNLAFLVDALKQRQALLEQHAPNLLVLAQRATTVLDPKFRDLEIVTHIRLATLQYSQEELQQFLDKVPLTVTGEAA